MTSFIKSRKVLSGAVLFVVSTVLLCFKYITEGTWLTCVGMSFALIGGGTIADKFLDARLKGKE